MTKFSNKKSLGQNFLTDENIARKIVESANLSSTDNVLEIGPGEGILTGCLAESGTHVLAIEIDRNLENILIKKFPKNRNIKIIFSDILKANLPKLIEENNFQNYKVVANLPYYITSKILRLLLETKFPPKEMILMVQKEVGKRIVAQDEKESILSISVKFYADPEILFEVPRENFEPAPVVDSAVIRIKRKKDVPEIDIQKFFSLVKAGFSAKRKMLANNLSSALSISKDELSERMQKAGLAPTVRAEKLKVEDWTKLCKNLVE
ncbi:MAG: 16S rRNA (adenine(1518)-N(6)/adenine(1519)-N(6))-dimethyltransferase RsmA [Candidatus Moranbacteria bacterium]|nr:16S rRNA (adenine(1518)-N(6)/adenine(1519)-N(6))-dimethyltransferase RsmA [Candidatus Moranbacteria bacterium]